jgi:hypothetical protein
MREEVKAVIPRVKGLLFEELERIDALCRR